MQYGTPMLWQQYCIAVQKTSKPFVSNKAINSNYSEHKTQCILFFFHLSASRLSKLTLFSHHKPLETLWFKNVFLNTHAKKAISQLLSFGGKR